MTNEEKVEQARREVVEAAMELANQCTDLQEFKSKWQNAIDRDQYVSFEISGNGIAIDFNAVTENSSAAVIAAKIKELTAKRAELEDSEPENPESEEYEDWLNECDELEDQIDEMNDWLEAKQASEDGEE